MTAQATPEDVAAAAKGDRAALARVVASMERMAWYCANRYRTGTTLSIDELAQEARLAVLKAVRAFKPSKGVPFGTYCFRWMRAGVLRLVVQENPKDPRHRSVRKRMRSLDEGFHDTDDLSLGEVLADEKPSPEAMLEVARKARALRELVMGLDARDSAVLQRRVMGETLEDIGDSFHLSRERIRQIERRSVATLRRRAALKGLAT